MNFEKFLKNPSYYERNKPGPALRNIQSFDLGLPAVDFDNRKAINEFIQKLDQNFHLVMLQKFFWESLILLKNLLCWRFEDLITFAKNSRNESKIESLTDEKIHQIYDWNLADLQLFSRK